MMPKALDWKAAIWAGIIAGLVYVMIVMALIMIQGMSPWGPPRMMAAMVMGKSVLPAMGEPATFDMGVMMVGMMVHLVLSVILAIVLGWGISRFGLGMAAAIIVGMIFGIVVYYVDFYGFTAVFPWFAMNRSLTILFGHAMFGAVAGGVYRGIARHDAKQAAEGANSAARA
jgi:hypothetical protein